MNFVCAFRVFKDMKLSASNTWLTCTHGKKQRTTVRRWMHRSYQYPTDSNSIGSFSSCKHLARARTVSNGSVWMIFKNLAHMSGATNIRLRLQIGTVSNLVKNRFFLILPCLSCTREFVSRPIKRTMYCHGFQRVLVKLRLQFEILKHMHDRKHALHHANHTDNPSAFKMPHRLDWYAK